MYSVTAASKMCGVSPDTLRAWERRYELVQPRRDGCGRRAYSEQDVTRLRLLRQATELGHPIRRLANLSVDQLRSMLEEAAEEVATSDETTHLQSRVFGALERYREDECDEVLGLAATLLDVDQLVHNMLTPLLQDAKARRERGELGVVQERMLGASVARTVCSILATFRRRAQGPVLLLATLPGEPHYLRLLLNALLAAREGVDCVYLGTDVPVAELAQAARRTGASCIGLSLTLHPQPPETQAALHSLAQAAPDGCQIWLGGEGASHLSRAKLPGACQVLLNGPCELRQRCRSLRER